MRKSNREKIREARKRDASTIVLSSMEDFYKLLVAGEKEPEDRILNPTQEKFWADPSFYKSYSGPAGCAKTSTLVADVIARAMFEPGSKHVIARNDFNDLKDTTRLRFDEMMTYLPKGTIVDKSESAPAKIWIQPAVSNSEMPDLLSEITFMGLNSDFGSYEFTTANVDEADECEESQILKLATRLRHKHGTRGLSICFNPPAKSHWLYTACTGMNAQDEYVKDPIFSHHKASPLENATNLPDTYYKEMDALTPELKMRLRDGEWGANFNGKPVIQEFNRKTHVAQLQFHGGVLYRFWDFGYRRPACLFVQVNQNDGRMHVLREFLGEYIEGGQFISEIKRITALHFKDAKNIRDYGDIAVKQHKDTGSMVALLAKEGISIISQKMEIDLSLKVVRSRFNTMVKGEPAIVIDKSCIILIEALVGGYRFKPDGQTPLKDGYYDHLMDCLRYGIYNIYGTTGLNYQYLQGHGDSSNIITNLSKYSKR